MTCIEGPRHGLISLVLAVGALVLAMVAPAPSDAAPPEVTTLQNPVLMLYPVQTTKVITLKWELERGSPPANLIVEEGDAELHNQPLFSNTGSSDLTVEYGKTYTAQLVQRFGGQPLGQELTITTEKANVEMSCAQRCIDSVDVQPHGGWAQFTIKTSETAVITVEASTKPPNPDGKWSNPADVAAFAGSIVPTDHYIPPLANLQANTTYHYAVRAHVKGHEQVKTGNFKTLTRRVDVNFDEIQMIDDSDGAVEGDCDCFFDFGVGDEVLEYGSQSDKKSIGSDTTVPLDAEASITNAPTEIQLGAKAIDTDCVTGQLCAVGEGPGPSGWEYDWESSEPGGAYHDSAGNKIMVPLSRQGPPWAPGDVDEQFTDSFTINVNGDLVYNVRGTYRVTYG